MIRSNQTEPDDNPPAPEEASEERAAMSSFRRPSAPLALFRAVFETTLDDAQRALIENSVNLAIIVTVPSAAWVKPAQKFCASLSRSSWVCIARDGTDRSRHKSSLGNDEVASALGRGCCTVGIAPSIDLLPAALITAADHYISLRGVNGKALSRAIKLFTGDCSKVADDDLCAGLDFDEIATAFRPGSDADAIVQRLTRARNRGPFATVAERLPDLDSAHELGPLRTYGLELKRDLEAYRASGLPWADVGRAILCHSEPGCGKTYGIKLVMDACSVPMLPMSISELFTKSAFLDEVIRGIREVYSRAAAMSAINDGSGGPPRPVCVLWDEVDALPNRATLGSRGADYWRPVITEFMLAVDTALAGPRRTTSGPGGGAIILAAATNYLAGVDAALRRPGRFERIVELGRQDRAGAANVLRHHLRGSLGEADIEAAARIAERLTSAEIAGHVQTARRSARQANRALHVDDLVAAILPASPTTLEKLFRICIHESGHAIGSLALGYGTLLSLSAAERGISLGRTDIDPPDEFTRVTIEDHVTVDLCGRAAERIFLSAEGVGSGGEQGDVATATRLIAGLHASAGLGDSIAYLASWENALQAVRADRGIRRAVERDLRRLESRALDIMRANRHALLELAELLMEQRHVDGDEARRIFAASGTAADRILFLGERRPHAGRYH
ncbi:AAA family ATPase [Bradyrhizobium sp. 195]|uniref:AAA family ATPase n=1 Tax=Bradyrhizobium sp. 195 TaxID=2782662 RepID=UPI002000F9A6|nr:AAA family ATPase [Bradyrhizobium sp. 195]UPK24195.1 AAA family ATPase [Bradyrhizobium sp. 195]